MKFATSLFFCGRFAAIPTLIAIFMLCGCSKHGPSNKISATAFDSAPEDIKQLWSDGMGAWKGHHYPEAATNFVSLHAKAGSLSPQQAEELEKATDEFGQEAFIAGNKGDQAAIRAVVMLRDASSRRARAVR
jgi:hypothetical protein